MYCLVHLVTLLIDFRLVLFYLRFPNYFLVLNQLFEIIDSIQENNWEIGEKIEPIESQLEELLDELNNTLRPKIESPIRKKPILSIAIAAGIGLLIGSLINSGRK